LIGNDIIDLDIPISPNWNNPRYLNKIYTPTEQIVIFNAVEPKIFLQLFWTLKEAAYKAHQRLFNLPRTYNPLDFQCKIISEDKENLQGIVRVNSYTYYTQSRITSLTIHSSATSRKTQSTSIKVFEDENILKDKLFGEYSLLLKEPKTNFRIKKNYHDIPELFSNNVNTNQVFSLSHHGKFAAFAIALMNC